MIAPRKLLLAGVVLAGLAPVLAAPAADGVRLRYRLDPEARYQQKMKMTTTMHLDIDGLPPEQAALLGGLLGQDMKQDLAMTLLLDTGKKGADGSVPFEMQIGALEGGMTVGEKQIPLPRPSESIRMKGKLGADGRALELDTSGMEALSDAMPTDLVGRLLRLAPSFPERELKIGDTLTTPQNWKMPFPGLPDSELNIQGATVFTLRSIEPGAAIFDVESNAAVNAEGEQASGMDLRLTGGGRGSARFDSKRGLFESIAMDMNIEMEMNLPAEAAQAEGAAAGPVMMNMSMKGPVEITMSRVGS